MGANVQVNPELLRSAAQAEMDVGSFVSAMDVGQSMAGAGTQVSGLVSARACEFVGDIVDRALGIVHEDLLAHSLRLATAADRYGQIDDEFGRRLRKFA